MSNDPYETDAATYTPHDFLLWKENDMLLITPKFQRRGVWKTPAKSFFIDTLIRGMLVPPMYFRLTQNDKKTGVIREVVDGQQRVRSVLEFIAGEYRLSSTLADADWAGKTFDGLTPKQQRSITEFGFPVYIFKGMTDQEVLEVFCRLNVNGVPLNKQELRNGRFFGLFKQVSYSLGLSHLEFWRRHRIFTEIKIARMSEVELTSELLIAANMGMQDKKGSIDTYYAEWDKEYPSADVDKKHFADCMEAIAETFPGTDIAKTEFNAPPLFYSLYCVVFHYLFGLPKISRQTPKKKMTAESRASLRRAVNRLSEVLAESRDPAARDGNRVKQGALAALVGDTASHRTRSSKRRENKVRSGDFEFFRANLSGRQAWTIPSGSR